MKYIFTAKEVGEALTRLLIEHNRLEIPITGEINQNTSWLIDTDYPENNMIEIEIL